MSPRSADPALRTALVEAAARLIATHGTEGLSLRRLAAEVGTSTMAIYTHFGSMEAVRREVRREAFARFGARLDHVEESDDPVADLLMLGWAYRENAVSDPDMYRAMFMAAPIDEADAAVGLETFSVLVSTVERCVAAGRFVDGDRVVLATQLWTSLHGAITLYLVGLLKGDEMVDIVMATATSLIASFGDAPAATARSFAMVRDRLRGEPMGAS